MTTGVPGQATSTQRPKITLRRLNSVVAGSTWAVLGRLSHTGSRNDKTVIIEWRRGNGLWKQIGVKRYQDDGSYTIHFSSETAGVSELRAKVKLHNRTLDKSAARTLTVLGPTPEETGEPAEPGESGIVSNLVVNGGTQTMDQFLTSILLDVDQYWKNIWASAGWSPPAVNYYWPDPGEATYHACSNGDYAAGTTYVNDYDAAYCSVNDYIVVSEAVATKLWLGEVNVSGVPSQPAGDFSVAYGVAHEYGHNIQIELGWGPYRASIPSRSWELHADCLAGNWMSSTYYSGKLEAGDIEEALGTARQLGDAWGSSDHGSPDERATAVWWGYNHTPADCDGYIRQWW
jgi:predicted metalloprotease